MRCLEDLFTLYLSNRDVTERKNRPSNGGGGGVGGVTEVLSVVSGGVRLLFSFLCSPAVIDFKRNEAVNNYFYPGNPPLPPNGSLAEAPPHALEKKKPPQFVSS